MTSKKAAREAAKIWRQKSRVDRGVVILYEAEVAGWMNELRDPGHWCPGAIAVDTAGKCWVAVGGDDYNGAHEWLSNEDTP